MPVSSHRRAPRGAPVRSAADAMQVFRLQMSRPLRPETLVMFLGDDCRGTQLVTVSDTVAQDAVVDVAEAMALAGAQMPGVAALVLATVRPGGTLLPGDVDLWFEATDVVEDATLELLDWLIVTRAGTFSAAAQLGAPSRWPHP